MRKKAFNWSDEELLPPELEGEDQEQRKYKDKYGKKKQSNYQKALIYKQNVQNKLTTGKNKMENNYYKKMKSNDKLADPSDQPSTYGAMETQL